MLGKSQAGTTRIKNKVITDILAGSRKQGVTIAYTSQSFDQVDKRVRNITDFVFYPMLLGDNFMCRISVFRGNRASIGNMMPDIRFFAEPLFSAFNTYEVVEPLTEDDTCKELFVPISQNPAWLKYLADKGYTEERAFKESESVQKALTRPEEEVTEGDPVAGI
jgi:hypothetical protein